MPIPLGVLAVAGAGAAGAAGAYELLETAIPTGSQSSISFTNLNSTYGTTYQHLQIRYTLRTSRAAFDDDLAIKLGVTANDYSRHMLQGNGTTVTSSGAGSTGSILIGKAASNNATASLYVAGVVDVLDAFETTKKKTIRAINGFPSSFIQLSSGAFHGTGNTDALSTIEILSLDSGNFTTASRISLYGLRSA